MANGTPTGQTNDPWYVDLGRGIIKFLGGSPYPKPIPPPLPYTVGQIRDMLGHVPGARALVIEKISDEGHTHIFLGYQPSRAQLEALSDSELAALALWFGNGTGDDLSRGEDTIRRVLIAGMQQYEGIPNAPPINDPGTGDGGVGGALSDLFSGVVKFFTRDGLPAGVEPRIFGVSRGTLALLVVAVVGVWLYTRRA